VEEPQEVPEEATDAEAIGAAKDRSRDLRLAVGCHGQLKMQTDTMVGPGRSLPPSADGLLAVLFLHCTAQGKPAKMTKPGIRQRDTGKENETGSQRRCGTRIPERTGVREEMADAAEMQQWDKGPGHETVATSQKREDIHQSPWTDFQTGSRGADSRIFD
jgi:hypothetical protein